MRVVSLLLAAFTGIAAVGCSSDEFFGFEYEDENNELIDEISKSNEYTNYLMACFQFQDSIINSVKKEPDLCFQRDSLIAYGRKVHLPYELIEANYRKLILKHPSFETFNQEQKQRVFYKALDNKTMAEMYGFMNKTIVRTKSGSPETYAQIAITLTNWNAGPDANRWQITPMPWASAITQCRSYCPGDKEYGGLAFSDNSGLFIDDSQAASTTIYDENGTPYLKRTMGMPFWEWSPYIPIFTFHTHPDQTMSNIAMSDEDWSSLSTFKKRGCNLMLIIVSDGDYTWTLDYPDE